VAALIDAVESFEASHAAVCEKGGSTYAVRRLCEMIPAARVVAASPGMRAIVEPVLGASARVVRSLLFDKNPAANWKVPWHQDLTIAVKERRDVDGFGPWSEKAGVTHAQPPVEVLERMVTVRLHLDDCGVENGPLRVLPGSHRLGVFEPANIGTARRELPEVTCTVAAGGVVVMRPLTLHASSPAERPGHRRVVHLEFAGEDLPGGLEWFEQSR
jgi:ectoine hydroxylase-related dioxygenase (phytanoyl-CoA dioxygenase family)